MHYFMLILTTILLLLHELSNALGTATICDNRACKCAQNNVSCTNLTPDLHFVLPNDTTTISFVDVPIKVFNNNTFTNENLQSVTWVASNIIIVEALYYNNLKYLDLSNNNIYKLFDNIFDNCPRLEYIDLSDNQLSTLSDNLFLHTQMLETVKLEKNIFSSISEHLFSMTNNIKKLSIGNPNLNVIGTNALSNLDKLEYLNIENSGIENLIKSSFGEHKHLNSILLNNCTHLLSIDNDIINSAPNIEIIELNNCGTIKFLPPSIVSLENLKRLQIFETEIQPNCHNGWFSQWFNETTTIIGYENNTQFISDINKLNCPAKIYHTSSSITLQLTKRGIINCKAYGNPLPAVTWLVPGGLTFHQNKEADTNITHHPNTHDWDFKEITSQSLSTDKNGSLQILRMLRTSIGNYTCYVSNKYGNDSKTVEVHLDSSVFFNIKINALLLGIASALLFLMLTILCYAFKLLLIRLVLL